MASATLRSLVRTLNLHTQCRAINTVGSTRSIEALEQENLRLKARLAALESAATPCAKGNDGPRPCLHGIRVLDLSRVLAAPYCTMLLGDLGADIIKIERPGEGDETRTWGPPFIPNKLEKESRGESAYFLSVNRNKRSVAIDFKKPEGVDLLKRLVACSDVLVQNYLPGTLEKIGLGYDDLAEINPGLIYATVTGYGVTGPDCRRPGYDVIVSARGGLMGITGEEGGPPAKVGVAITDLCTGLYAFGNILAALLARGRDGHSGHGGQRVDASLLETQVATLANIAGNFLLAGQDAGRWGTAHPSIVPYQSFATADGHVVLGATNDAAWQRLCTELGRSDWAQDPRLRTNQMRVQHREEVVRGLSQELGKRSTASCLQLLDRAQVANGPINSMREVFSDPQVLARDMVQTVHHRALGDIQLVGPAVKLGRTPASITRAPPLLGEHTDEVLGEVLSLSAEAIAGLRKDKVVQ